MNSNRISELDALRGIAAFTVLIGHCFAVFPAAYDIFTSRSMETTNYTLKYLTFSPLHIFWNGHAAVTLFFILSGFVLSVSHYDVRKFKYSNYIVKRMCRLYIPYIVIVTISVLLGNFYQSKYGIDNVSYPFLESWSSKINYIDYIKLSLLHGKTNIVDFPLWTIIIEIEISIILPFFIMLIKRFNLILNILFILLCIVSVKLLVHTSLSNSIPDIKHLYFLPFFMVGSLMYKFRLKIKSWKMNNMIFKLLIYSSILILCNWEWMMVWFIKFDKNSFLYLISDFMVAIGCILLMIVVLSSTGSIKNTLNTLAFQFLGKISYSLYLVHVIVIMFVLYNFKSTKLDYLIPLFIISTLLVSYAYFLYIEQPSVKIGKYLASTFTKETKIIEQSH
jgi:peptidoglycan/LPS O-acetylase OafA/YrhL